MEQGDWDALLKLQEAEELELVKEVE